MDERLAIFRAGLAESDQIAKEQKQGKAEADARNPRVALNGPPGYRAHHFGRAKTTAFLERAIMQAAIRDKLRDA
jgi:hypothetical protein